MDRRGSVRAAPLRGPPGDPASLGYGARTGHTQPRERHSFVFSFTTYCVRGSSSYSSYKLEATLYS